MGCRTWRPGWFADRRGEPSEPAVPSPQFVDEPAVAPGPAVVGRGLGLRPGETAAEKALDLTKTLAQVRHEHAIAERERVGQLQLLNQELAESIRLVRQAAAALEQAEIEIGDLANKLDESTKRAEGLSKQLETARGENEQFLLQLLNRLQNREPQTGAADSNGPTP